MKRVLSFLMLGIVLLTACQSHEKTEITVSAAASLQDALSDLKVVFEEEHPDIQVDFNFGGSGALQQQITQGAPVDVFISASEDAYAPLVEAGKIDKEHNQVLLKNRLVLIVPKGDFTIQSLPDLVQTEKIAIGTPASVPAGGYAQQVLTYAQLWDDLSEQLVFTKDVRQVLTYVETKNVDAGFVYKTDARLSNKIDVVEELDESWHDPVQYPVGVMAQSRQQREAITFFEFLQTDHALHIFEEYGFQRMSGP